MEWEITVRIYLLRLDTSVGDAADAADGMTANRADAALKSPDRRTILLFEDEPDIRASLSDQMEDPSYRAIENGHRAMAPLYGTEHIDLLFTHIVMPGGLNGLDLARRVHKHTPGLTVLYTTGYSDDILARAGPLDDSAVVPCKPYNNKARAAALEWAMES